MPLGHSAARSGTAEADMTRMDGAPAGAGQGVGRQDAATSRLHIFVNRRKFDESDGVQPTMTGRQIAALVEVPADIAVVRRETGAEREEVGVDQAVSVKNGDHFLATRKTVEGGHGGDCVR